MILAFIIGCNKDKITDSQGMNDNSVFKYTIVNNLVIIFIHYRI